MKIFISLSLLCILLPEQKHPPKSGARQTGNVIATNAHHFTAGSRQHETSQNNFPPCKRLVLRRKDKSISICRQQDHVPRDVKRMRSKMIKTHNHEFRIAELLNSATQKDYASPSYKSHKTDTNKT